MQQSSDGLSLERWLGVLRRRGLWILLCCVLAGTAAYGLSKHQIKKYTGTASLIFKSNQLTQQIAGLPTTVSVQAQQNSNIRLVQVGDMAAKTARKLGQGLTQQKVSQSLSVAQQGETNIAGESSIINVSASATSPTLAAAIANTYVEQFVVEQQTSNHQYFASALATVRKQLAALPPKQRLRGAGITLQNREQNLKLLANLQYGGVQLAQSAAVPTRPSSPRTLRNTLIGGTLGLLLGLGLALLLEYLDRRIKEPEELESIYRSPLLGVVPNGTSLALSARTTPDTPLAPPPPAAAEAFSLILAHLRSFNAERDMRTVLVTSASSGAGATTIALYLAEAAAKSGSRTLLLEMDLRRPTLAEHLCLQPRLGARDVLIDATLLSEAAQSINLQTPVDHGVTTRPTLDIVTADSAGSPAPAELIMSHTVETLLERAKSTYDLVVIDSPPLTAVSDAFPILGKADGIIVVSSIGRDRTDTARELHQVLDRSAAPLLGVIANRGKSKSRNSYHYPKKETTPSAAVTTNGVVSPGEPRLTTEV